MPQPCKECPFSTAFKGRYPSERVLMYIAAACESGEHQKECHTTDYRTDCEGVRRFFAGETEGVFTSLVEMAEARSTDSMAADLLREVERLTGARMESAAVAAGPSAAAY